MTKDSIVYTRPLSLAFRGRAFTANTETYLFSRHLSSVAALFSVMALVYMVAAEARPAVDVSLRFAIIVMTLFPPLILDSRQKPVDIDGRAPEVAPQRVVMVDLLPIIFALSMFHLILELSLS